MVRGLDVVCEVVAQIQRLEVLLGALDLRALARAQDGRAVAAALGLGDEVDALLAVHVLDVRPVGVVAAERRVDLELRGELGEYLHGLRLVERHRVGLLDAGGVVDHVVVERLVVRRLPSILVQEGREVLYRQDVHGVPVALWQARVLDAPCHDLDLRRLDLGSDLR